MTVFASVCRLTAIGRRSFPVAASIVWNTLPVHVRWPPSISTFLSTAKHSCFNSHFLTSLFNIPYLQYYITADFEMAIAVSATYKTLINWLIDWLLRQSSSLVVVNRRHWNVDPIA